MKETLRRLLPKQNITLTDGQLDTLARFGQALLEKNQVMNLTAITAPDKVAELHFYDCLALLNAADFRGKRVIDIGCGAGFPGVPLKIAESSMDLTLLDSLGKRMDWLREVLPELHVEANVVTARAEEYVVSCREGFDIAVSRAVARLNILAELCLPYVKVGGVLMYSTCTLNGRENESVVRGFLKSHPDFELEPLELPEVFPENTTGMLRLLPGEYDTDGFFLAKLRRKA